ncbi:Zn-ribbon domain-containing OB-fold protein [Variovorax sp. GB1P17]|uniref:Zn-ribbon domain-containing OB-fold protein n=1 Tax=Variovorax sp. GB1P17 TaxID=3443740 RepID=UPI003F464FBF
MNEIIERMQALTIPGPIPSAISAPFWDATAQGRFELQRCDDCHRWVFYPRNHCPHCWGSSLHWQPAQGRGRLKSFSFVHRPGHAAWQSVAPYPVALVELAEGPTMLSTLLVTSEDQASLRIGMPLKVQLVRVGKFTLPMFVLSDEEA